MMNDTAEALKRVQTQMVMLDAAEDGLERGYAALGYTLLEVSEMQYWRLHFKSFQEYLDSLAVKSHKSAGRLKQYLLAVRDLQNTFTRPQLESMGITKALQIRQAKDYAIVLPDNLRAAALDQTVTASALKKLIATTLRVPEEEGDWMDLDFAFMVTPEQRATIEDAINAAKHTDPVTKATISESAQNLDIMLKLSMEYLGAHAGEVV